MTSGIEGTEHAENMLVLKAPWYRQTWVKNTAYFLYVWLFMPILVQLVLLLFALAIDWVLDYLNLDVPDFFEALVFVGGAFIISFWIGYKTRFSKKRLPQANQTFFQRHKIEIALILITLSLFLISVLIDRESFYSNSLHPVMGLSFPAFWVFFIILSFGGSPFYLVLLLPVGIYIFYFLGVVMRTKILGELKVKRQEVLLLAIAMAVLLGGCAWKLQEQAQNSLTTKERQMTTISEGTQQGQRYGGDSINYLYRPFSEEGVLTPLQGDSLLRIESDFPRLDGATALFPIYASAVNAIYKAPETDEERNAMRELVQNSRTPNAYAHLIADEVDLIFVAAPSKKQIEAAQAAGLELKMTPLGKEAFVFLINEKNPVHSLTVEQIRSIYAGATNDWSEVGGTKGAIRAFQRPEGSGSQSTMVNKVMQNIPLREPLREEFFQGMGGVLVGVADYRNAENAIGYSFRFYASSLNKVEGVRLLAVNGIEPTRENIRNGSYPFTSELFMVTARPASENTQKLMDWFLSEQGQQLVQDVGYVPLLER